MITKSNTSIYLTEHTSHTSFFFLSFLEIVVASPPDRRVTRDDIGVASAGATANVATTSCSSGSTSSRSHNPSSPGRNGQLASKFPRYYLPKYISTIRIYLFTVHRRNMPDIILCIYALSTNNTYTYFR